MVDQEKDISHTTRHVVLIIEDEDPVREVVKTMVEKMGYAALEAGMGKEAIDFSNDPDVRFDIVLLDMDMPDMKGPEIFRQIKSVRPDIKVIVTSGQSEDEAVEKLMEEGACGFLQKPFPYKNLEAVLVLHLDRRLESRVRTFDNFLSVTEGKGVQNVRIVDISRGGMAFVCNKNTDDKDALIDVAVILADKGVDLDELECSIVSEYTLNPVDPEKGEAFKRIGVSFGRMKREQFERLTALVNACS